jgi:hypothetical protein
MFKTRVFVSRRGSESTIGVLVVLALEGGSAGSGLSRGCRNVEESIALIAIRKARQCLSRV